MSPEEFLNLPDRQRAHVIVQLFEAQLRDIPAPKKILPPKYDAKFTKGKDVYCFMSEMTLRDLEYWHGKKLEGAQAGGKWAAKDAKIAETMARWITWRQCYPTEQWYGERGDKKGTAAPPSREPKLHNWSDSPRRSSQSESNDGYDDPPAPKPADDDYGTEDMGEIPF